jgi:hypothetical protein
MSDILLFQLISKAKLIKHVVVMNRRERQTEREKETERERESDSAKKRGQSQRYTDRLPTKQTDF